MTNYEKALAALNELRRDAQGDELVELHFATGRLLKAKSWATDPVAMTWQHWFPA